MEGDDEFADAQTHIEAEGVRSMPRRHTLEEWAAEGLARGGHADGTGPNADVTVSRAAANGSVTSSAMQPLALDRRLSAGAGTSAVDGVAASGGETSPRGTAAALEGRSKATRRLAVTTFVTCALRRWMSGSMASSSSSPGTASASASASSSAAPPHALLAGAPPAASGSASEAACPSSPPSPRAPSLPAGGPSSGQHSGVAGSSTAVGVGASDGPSCRASERAVCSEASSLTSSSMGGITSAHLPHSAAAAGSSSSSSCSAARDTVRHSQCLSSCHGRCQQHHYGGKDKGIAGPSDSERQSDTLADLAEAGSSGRIHTSSLLADSGVTASEDVGGDADSDNGSCGEASSSMSVVLGGGMENSPMSLPPGDGGYHMEKVSSLSLPPSRIFNLHGSSNAQGGGEGGSSARGGSS